MVFSSFLVVVDQLNVKSVLAFKAEDDAPVGPDCRRPQPFHVAFKRMQAIAGNVQSLRRRGGIEHRKDSFNGFDQIRAYSTPVSTFIQTFQTAVLKTPN
jgi:hypothetical protein